MRRPAGVRPRHAGRSAAPTGRARDAIVTPIAGLTIVATSRCNQRCSYCRVRQQPSSAPAWPAVRQALDGLLASPADRVRIAFTGGEPLLSPSLVARAVTHVDAHRRPDQRVRFRLLTNGLLLNERVLSWLDRHEIELQLSCDGIRTSQERRSPGTFDRLERVMARMRSRHAAYLQSRVSVTVTLVPETIPDLAASISHLMVHGAARIGLSPAMDVPCRRTGLLGELDDQFGEIFRVSLDHYRMAGVVPFAPFRRSPFDLFRSRSRWECQAPLARALTVDSDGGLSACLLASRSYTAGRRLGPAVRRAVGALRLDASDGSLDDQRRAVAARASGARILASDARRHSDWGDCRDCRWARQCRVCPLTTSGKTDSQGSLYVPPLLCAFSQVASKYRERFPLMPPSDVRWA